MSDDIRRENFADEASYLQFQHNWLEMQRSQNWYHAVGGRAHDSYRKRAAKRHRAWYEKNRQRVIDYIKAWKAANKDHVRAYMRHYYATRYANDADFRLRERAEALVRYNRKMADPERREKERERDRARYARKKAARLAGNI